MRKGRKEMRKLIIVAGATGVGKTSFIGAIRPHYDALNILIDTGTIPKEKAAEQITICLQQGLTFGIETDLSDEFVIDTIKTAHERKYYIELYYIFLPTAEECINRVTNRLKYGGRMMSDKDIILSFNKISDRLDAILPYCNDVSYFDNFNGFVECQSF
ncbi:MAG: hypothetical protein IJ410_04870 [Oscillospiraceae bacterium]|nr:hypothetical protein [Oscillospiraceae bacterium]